MNESEVHTNKANWIYKGKSLRIAWFRYTWWKKFAKPASWFFSYKNYKQIAVIQLCILGLLIGYKKEI